MVRAQASRPSGPSHSALFTLEDAKIGFNIFCCICGIGSLGMPSNYARAGSYYATIALVFMAAANMYATVVLSKVLLAAPASVKTYGDLGEWVCGKWGRFLVVVSQMAVCLLTPCAYLVLGGTLLDVLFPDSFSQTFWIIFMALLAVPVALTPTLKEGAGTAVAGCVGTIVADVVGVSVLLYETRGHPTAPSPDISLGQVLTTFGNLSLAYGAAILVPSLQRQHSHPERMPRVIMVALGTASAFFLAVAIAGYVAGGCQLSGNLLFSIVNTTDPYAESTLGFIADRGAVIMAYMFMQLHIAIAFSMLLHPPFYVAERLILGMHKVDSLATDNEDRLLEEKLSYRVSASPIVESESAATDVKINCNAVEEMDGTRLSQSSEAAEEAERAEYRGGRNFIRYALVRIALIVVLVVVSILLRDHFLDLVDFTGATAISMCCLILPLVFYMKVFWAKLPLHEKAISIAIVSICAVVGCYVMIYAGKNLFNPDDDTATFPYCEAAFQTDPYYVRNATTST
ncbi:hypothetical protein BBJ28_00007693 [Nothophytophthora sp. Chile5]|nr:hypothetical protein BBJ28_00007693 [Nothophytophthora sp. Chile5]